MYSIVTEERDSLPVSKACQYLGVDRNCYRDWIRHRQTSANTEPDHEELRSLIREIAGGNPRYGYRRVAKTLQRMEYKVNHKLVLRLMKAENLLCRKRRFKVQTTDSNHNLRVYPNLAKNMEVTGLNQLWVSDITYVHLLKEFAYLVVILDVHSRRCLGWQLSRNIDAQLTLDALDEALAARKDMDLSGLVHHSDQGVQYASNEYVQTLLENNIQISMSRKGNPYDNAYAESFIKTLKYEEVYLKEYDSFNDALENIQEFIEDVYNQKRLHSSIGYKTPKEYEKEVLLNTKVA